MINNKQRELLEHLLNIVFTSDYVYFNKRTYRSAIRIRDTNIRSPPTLVQAINLVHNYSLSSILRDGVSSDRNDQSIFCLKDCRETYLDTLEEEVKLKDMLEEKDNIVNEYFQTLASVIVNKVELLGEILLKNKENYLKASYLERYASSLISQLESDFYNYRVDNIVVKNKRKFENGSNFCAFFFRSQEVNYWNTNISDTIAEKFKNLSERGIPENEITKMQSIINDLKEILKDLYLLRVYDRQYTVQYKYPKDYNAHAATRRRSNDLSTFLKDKFFYPKLKVALFQAQLRLYLATGNSEVIELIKDIK